MPFPDQDWGTDFAAHVEWVSDCDLGYYVIKIPNSRARDFIRDHGLDVPACNRFDGVINAWRGPYRAEEINFDTPKGQPVIPGVPNPGDPNPYKYHREWIHVIQGYYLVNISSEAIRGRIADIGLDEAKINGTYPNAIGGPYDDDPIEEGDDRGTGPDGE